MAASEENVNRPAGIVRATLKVIVWVYPFILAGGLILAGVHFKDFTVLSTATPAGGIQRIVIGPNETYTFNVDIILGSLGNTIGENNTWGIGASNPESTPTSWDIGKFRFWLESNESLHVGFTYSNRTGADRYEEHIGCTPFGMTDITKGGLYGYAITNLNTTSVVDAELNFETSWNHYEKPYFYYGIVALTIAIIYPVIILIKKIVEWLS